MATVEKQADRRRTMSDTGCRPVGELVPIEERELQPDRFAELLEYMADLLVEARRQRMAAAPYRNSRDPRVRTAIGCLSELERSLVEVSVQAASVHQLLQRVRLI
jgi:hypothetical protein